MLIISEVIGVILWLLVQALGESMGLGLGKKLILSLSTFLVLYFVSGVNLNPLYTLFFEADPWPRLASQASGSAIVALILWIIGQQKSPQLG